MRPATPFRADAGPRATSRAGTVVTASLLVAVLAAAVPSPAGAAIFADDDARRAIVDIRARLEQQQQSIAQLTQRMTDALARLERIEGAYATSRAQLEQAAQLEQLRTEIARLRGQLEVQVNELAGVQRRQRDLFEGVDARIKRFEPVQVTIDGQAVDVDPAEKRGFDAALAQFRAGDFRASHAAFQQFLAQYPGSPYAQNAQFWAGSAQFALKDWKAAIASHQALLARHPDSPRAPDAMLAIGSAQLELADRAGARDTLQSLVEKYPTAPAAETAKLRLAAMPTTPPAAAGTGAGAAGGAGGTGAAGTRRTPTPQR